MALKPASIFAGQVFEKFADECGTNELVRRLHAKARFAVYALLREGSMAGMFFGGFVTAVSMGTALFGGMVPAGAVGSDLLSLALAVATAVTVASASALDG